MGETREFPIGVVLSVTTGTLLADFSSMHEAIEWLAGSPVWTHQLPRVSREAAAVIFKAHPALAEVDASGVNPDNWRAFLAEMAARFGETLAIPKMTLDEHERIDPISELAEKVHPDRIIPVVVPARGEATP